MAGKLKVEVLVGLVDRLSGPLRALTRGVKHETKGLDATLARMANTTIVGGALVQSAAAVLAPLQQAVSAFAEAEDAATRFKLSMMDATGAVLPSYQALSNLAQQLGDRLPGSTADFLAMMTMLRRQGMDAQTILAGTGEAAANLAVMLKMTPEGAAEFTAKLQDATGTAAADMLALADTIQRTFNVGVDPSNMLAAYGSLSPAMALIKQQGLAGAQAMAPLLAMLDQASLSGESAGNALRKVFSRSFGGTKKADAALKDQRLTFVGPDGEFLGLDNLFAQLAKLKQVSSQERLETLSDIWGDDSETLQALNTIIEKGAAGYQQMAVKLREQAALEQRMVVLLGTLKNLWDATSGTVTNLAARIGELLAPEIKQLTEAMGRWAAQARRWIDANPALAKGLVKWTAVIGLALLALGGISLAVGAVAGVLAFWLVPLRVVGSLLIRLGPLLLGVGRMVRGLWWGLLLLTRLVGPLGVLRVAVMALGTALLANPIGLVIIAVAAVIAVFIYWDEIIQALSKSWAWLVKQLGFDPVAVIKAKWEALVTYMTNLRERIMAPWRSLPAEYRSIGDSMMSGIEAGIVGGTPGLMARMVNLGIGLGAKLRDVMGVHSPSRVFADIGANLVRGLEVGIASRQAVPSALLAGLVALPAAAAAAVPAPGPRDGAGVTINMPITINAPPGTDTAALAALVRREVQGATRQAAGRIAALYDGSDGL
ncbi:MAG TPA: phage tail tape measure protein [Lamprocystis sp. (in: g-proteobacteria)]|nr:phage tail tape measure protein [Lamprocystis sp. (in: g-proteobacteria)]